MTIAELRRIRMAKGLSLTEISRRTRIGVGHLRKIEEGALSGLPPGFYARAFVRAYAEAVGADAEAVLDTLAGQLPGAQPAAASATGSMSSTPAGDLVPDARMCVIKQILERHDALTHRVEDAHATQSIDARRPIQRLLAAGLDGVLMSAMYASVLGLTAYACGVSISELVRVAGVAVFTVLGLITVLYVLMMGGIAGRTIGSMLLDVPLGEDPPAPLKLHAIWRRSLRFMRADASAAVEVVSMLARTRKAA